MTPFGQMLKDLITESGEGISRIASLSRIDRPTIYKYISGDRMPTKEGLSRLLDVVKATAEEKRNLIAQYELENEGEVIYYQRQAIKRLLESLGTINVWDSSSSTHRTPEVPAQNDSSSPISVLRSKAAVLSELLRAVSAEQCEICIFPGIPTETLHFIIDTVSRESKNSLPIRHVWSYPKQIQSDRDVQRCIEGLSDAITFSMSPNINYQTYYIYESGNILPSEANVFPYTIVFSQLILQLDPDATCAIAMRSPEVIEIYRDRFNQMVSTGQVLVSSGADATKAISSFSQMEQQSGQIYKIMLQPCLPRFAADETVNRVLSQIGNHNADMAAQMKGRVELLRQADSDKAVFSELGITLFAEKGYVEDLPDLLYEAIIREERTGILRGLRAYCFSHECRMLRPNGLRISENVMVEICRDTGVAFVLTDKTEHRVAVVKEDGVVKAFCDFMEYLFRSEHVASREETVSMIDRYIGYLENK